MARLALRLITIKPLSYFLGLKKRILDDDLDDPSDKYLQILSLVGLEETRWPEDFLVRSAMALILLGVLRSSGYFGVVKNSGAAESYTPNELFIGSLILKHLQVIL